MKRKFLKLLTLQILLLIILGTSGYIYLKAPETFPDFPKIVGVVILIITLKIVSIKINIKDFLKKAISLFL